MNILEQEDIIKGLPDQALMQEAKMPSGQVPQFLVVSEIQRRKDMRKRYDAERPQEGTVKDQILGEASMGIMGAMPPQMAMAPQMPQGMPQMPPQGIQQAMPPQRMSGGGVVRLFEGGGTGPEAIIRSVLAQNPNATMVDFLEAGITEEQAKAYYHLINPGVMDRARSKAPFGRPASEIYQGAGLDTDIQMFDPAKIPPGEGSSNVYAGADGFMGLGAIPKAIGNMFTPEKKDLSSLITDEERAINQADVARQREDDRLMQGIAGAISSPYIPSPIDAQVSRDLPLTLSASEKALTKAEEDRIKLAQMPFKDRGVRDIFGDELVDAVGGAYDSAANLVGSGIDSLANSSYGRMIANLVPDDISGSLSRFFPMKDDIEMADVDFFDQSIYGTGSGKKADLGEGAPSDLVKETVANDASSGEETKDPLRSLRSTLGAERVDAGNLPLVSGADAASGRLAELQAMIDKQSAAGTDAARGAALVALGTGIMEGKTAQGGREAANILAKDAQAQGALKLEGAKMRLQDARSAERLQIMRDDLLARVGISQNQNNRTALIEVNKAIDALEDDPMLNLQIQTAIKEGKEPESPKYRRLMQLRQASVFLTQLVSPETKQFFSEVESGGSSVQTPAPTGFSIGARG